MTISKTTAVSGAILSLFALPSLASAADVAVLKNGQAAVGIVADVREATADGAAVLKDAANWLAESLQQASGAEFSVADQLNERPSLILARASAWPDVARSAGLKSGRYDDYAIATRPDEDRIYVLGNSEAAARHGVADLLRRWGFRWFAPSKRWRAAPRLRNLAVDLKIVESPHLIERRIWYADGMSGDDLRPLMKDYERWAIANRLTLRGLTRTGHSYGNIIGRNKDAFAANPKLTALLPEKGSPVWQYGSEYSDAEIAVRFDKSYAALKADDDPTVHYSRYFDPVKVPGEDAGASYIHATPQDEVAVSRFRRGLPGYLIPSCAMTARLGVAPTAKPVKLTVFMRKEVIFEKEFRSTGDFHEAAIELPRAFEYRVEFTGDFELRVPAETPFIFESSVSRPAWISYSGPHYFYVPKGTSELIVDANPRLSVVIPGKGRRDLHPADRIEGTSHIVVKVPRGADGQLWHTTTQTRGQVMLLNTPPLFSFHRNTVFAPREVSESEGLSTRR